MVAHVPKDELCRRYGIQPRDLRKLDSAVPTSVPSILSRRNCIILTMLHLRVVITAQEVTIFDSVGSEDRCVARVLQRFCRRYVRLRVDVLLI